MESSKFCDLLRQVYNRTKMGKLEWCETPDESTFETEFPNGSSLHVARKIHFLDDEQFEFRIHAMLLNSAGNVVDEEVDDDSDWMGELYATARRQARRGDEVVQEILDAIRE